MDITSLKKIRTLYTWMVNFFKELYSRIKDYSEHYVRETVYLSILFILLLLAIYMNMSLIMTLSLSFPFGKQFYNRLDKIIKNNSKQPEIECFYLCLLYILLSYAFSQYDFTLLYNHLGVVLSVI